MPDDIYQRSVSPAESIERLPIASRFITSPTPGSNSKRKENVAGIGSGMTMMADAQSIDESDEAGLDPGDEAEATDKMGKPYLAGLKGMMMNRARMGSSGSGGGKGGTTPRGQSPYRGLGSKTPTPQKERGPSSSSTRSNLLPARSHQSLPPPARTTPGGGGVTSRQSLVETNTNFNSRSGSGTPTPGATPRGATPYGATASRKLQKPAPLNGDADDAMVLPPHLLPEDLRICLEVLEGPTLKGHITLCESLRKRYDDQYPLVRSLADVFVANVRVVSLHSELAWGRIDPPHFNSRTY